MISEILKTKPHLMDQVDVDGSGLIEFHEFVKFIVSGNKEILLAFKKIQKIGQIVETKNMQLSR